MDDFNERPDCTMDDFNDMNDDIDKHSSAIKEEFSQDETPAKNKNTSEKS